MDRDNDGKKPKNRTDKAMARLETPVTESAQRQRRTRIANNEDKGKSTKKGKVPPGGTPWKPGQSGNPAGKPKGTKSLKHRIQDRMLELLEAETVDPLNPTGKKSGSYFDIFLKNVLDQALAGEKVARAFVMERLVSADVINELDAYINRGKREDRYFLSYQLYKDAFDEQQAILMSKKPVVFVMSGRRAGKTEAIHRKIVDQLAIKEVCQVVYIAKTQTIGMDQVWNGVKVHLNNLGIEILEERRNEGYLKIENGSEFWVWGNNTKEDREKLRGFNWSLAIIDEAQSQKELEYLMTSILEPPLAQNKGQLILCGTGPRVRGTEWERIYTDEVHYPGLRLNWNISVNPFVEDAGKILDEILQKHSWTASTPRYIQEWLGKIAYDDDALVYRLSAENLFDDVQFKQWATGRNAQGQPVLYNNKAVSPGDIHFCGGIDVGFEDADSVIVLAYADHRPDIFIVYEKKERRTGIEQLKSTIKAAIDYIKTDPLFDGIPTHNRTSFMFYMDSGGGGKKISFDFTVGDNLPIQPAYKHEKALGIEQLQEEVKARFLKVRGSVVNGVIVGDSPFIDEAMKTVFGRDEQDNLTRAVDDDTYHPDELDSVLYGYRTIKMFRKGGI